MATITAQKSGNWSDTTVWIGGVVPGSSDTAVTAGYTITVTDNRSCTRAQVNGGGTLAVNAGCTLTISAFLQSSGSGTSTLVGPGTISTNSISWGAATNWIWNSGIQVVVNPLNTISTNGGGQTYSGDGTGTLTTTQFTLGATDNWYGIALNCSSSIEADGTWGTTGLPTLYNLNCPTVTLSGGTVQGNTTVTGNWVISGGTVGTSNSDITTFIAQPTEFDDANNDLHINGTLIVDFNNTLSMYPANGEDLAWIFTVQFANPNASFAINSWTVQASNAASSGRSTRCITTNWQR